MEILYQFFNRDALTEKQIIHNKVLVSSDRKKNSIVYLENPTTLLAPFFEFSITPAYIRLLQTLVEGFLKVVRHPKKAVFFSCELLQIIFPIKLHACLRKRAIV